MLSALGLSHKTAPVEIRERIAFGEAEIQPMLARLHERACIDECVLLSTCNRTEVYLVSRGDPPVAETIDVLGASRGVARATFEPSLYIHQGAAAAHHALRVAAGLDSMILGEPQILGQVRRAFDVARAARAIGPVLNRLMQQAITTGRRVRRETGLSRTAPSVPRAALAQCRRVLGSVRGRPMVVVGAGDMAALVIKVFAAADARIVAVANRTLEGARALARRIGTDAISLDDIGTAAANADILIVCVGATEPIILRQMLQVDGTRSGPLMVIDLGVPRGVDAAVTSLPEVTLFDLDGLAGADAGVPISADDLAQADRIVGHTLDLFERWMASRDAVPLIAALRSRAEAIVEGELARARTRRRGLGDGQQEVTRAIVEAVVRKLLHAPIVRLRESAARRDAQILKLASELFDLNVEPADPKDPGKTG